MERYHSFDEAVLAAAAEVQLKPEKIVVVLEFPGAGSDRFAIAERSLARKSAVFAWVAKLEVRAATEGKGKGKGKGAKDGQGADAGAAR